MKLLKDFIKEEEGLGTVELVLLIAILVSIALIFKNSITTFVEGLMGKFFNAKDIDVNTTTNTITP